jgi:hypothetical protein
LKKIGRRELGLGTHRTSCIFVSVFLWRGFLSVLLPFVALPLKRPRVDQEKGCQYVLRVLFMVRESLHMYDCTTSFQIFSSFSGLIANIPVRKELAIHLHHFHSNADRSVRVLPMCPFLSLLAI